MNTLWQWIKDGLSFGIMMSVGLLVFIAIFAALGMVLPAPAAVAVTAL